MVFNVLYVGHCLSLSALWQTEGVVLSFPLQQNPRVISCISKFIYLDENDLISSFIYLIPFSRANSKVQLVYCMWKWDKHSTAGSV